MNAHLEPTNSNPTGDDKLWKLYDDLRWYATELRKTVSPKGELNVHGEASVFADAESTMQRIRVRRKELGLGKVGDPEDSDVKDLFKQRSELEEQWKKIFFYPDGEMRTAFTPMQEAQLKSLEEAQGKITAEIRSMKKDGR